MKRNETFIQTLIAGGIAAEDTQNPGRVIVHDWVRLTMINLDRDFARTHKEIDIPSLIEHVEIEENGAITIQKCDGSEAAQDAANRVFQALERARH